VLVDRRDRLERSPVAHLREDDDLRCRCVAANSWLTSGGPTVSSDPVIRSRGGPGGNRARAGGCREGLAVAGVALRVLTHDEFAGEGYNRGPVLSCALREGIGDDPRLPSLPYRRGPVALRLVRLAAGCAYGPEQDQRGYLGWLPGRELARDEGAHGVTDHGCRPDTQGVEHRGEVLSMRDDADLIRRLAQSTRMTV
jgi:hypothetical protein